MIKGNDVIHSGSEVPAVIDVEYLGDFRLHLLFKDGTEGNVDLAEEAKRARFQAFLRERRFTEFGLTQGTLVWSDEVDISPYYLYERVKQSHA